MCEQKIVFESLIEALFFIYFFFGEFTTTFDK